MGVSLDLRKAHLSRTHGDIVAVLTWVNDSRALVLIPAIRKDAGWYVVDESAAYQWDINAIDAGERRAALTHIDQQSHIACRILGIEPSLRNRGRIVNIITDTLPDLIRMPSAPLPEYLRGAVGQMILKADGKPIASEDIRVEDEGAQYA
jgi:hypothetical protein